MNNFEETWGLEEIWSFGKNLKFEEIWSLEVIWSFEEFLKKFEVLKNFEEFF